MVGDNSSIDWNEPPWIAPPFGGRDIVVGEKRVEGREEKGLMV